MIEDPIIFIIGCLILSYVLIIGVKSYSITLIIIFSFSFFQGAIQLLGIPTIVPRLFLEFAILVLFFKTLYILKTKQKKMQFKWGTWMFLVFIITIVSAIINQVPVISLLLFSRHVFIFYLLFIAIYNSNLSLKEIRKVNYWIVGLFIIQIPAAIIKILIYGTHIVEGGGIGTVSVQGGSLALLIPLIPISFLFSRFLYNRKFVNLLFIIAFLIISVASGKRATAFLLPVLLIILIVIYNNVYKKGNIIKLTKFVSGIIIVSVIALFVTSQTSPYLNPEGIRYGGSFNLKYMYNKMLSYSTSYDSKNPGAGRIASYKTTYNYVYHKKGLDKVLFGFGPGSIIGSFLINKNMSIKNIHNLPYGARNGFIWFFLQIGLLGALFYTSFIISLLRDIYHNFKVNKHYIYKAPILLGIIGCIFIFIFDFLIYSISFITSGVTMPVLLYLSAIFLSPKIGPKMN